MSLSTFDATLLAIRVLRSFPPSGCSKDPCCGGHTAAEILAQWEAVFPTVPITIEQITALLTAQAKRGVFRTGCFNGVQCFGVNTMMVQSNFHNIVYLRQQDGYNGFIPGECGGSNGVTSSTGNAGATASYTTNSGSCQGSGTGGINGTSTVRCS
jgi:hypothetical protein